MGNGTSFGDLGEDDEDDQIAAINAETARADDRRPLWPSLPAR
jgi:hypothetical protein